MFEVSREVDWLGRQTTGGSMGRKSLNGFKRSN